MDKKKIKLKAGDILSFELEPDKYGFARVLAKVKLGDAIEIYDFFSNSPDDYKEAIDHPPIFSPIILDGHSLFWKRLRGNWMLMERNDKFKFEKGSDFKFKYGPKGLYKIIDLDGNVYNDISAAEAEKYPDYSVYGDGNVKNRISFILNKRK